MKSFLLINLIVVVTLLTFNSCKKTISTTDINDDYFPLAVGNYWELSHRGTYTVDQIVNIEGKQYFRVTFASNLSTTLPPIRDTMYYRKTADGKVYKRDHATNEYLKFDFKATKGQSWNYKRENVPIDDNFTWKATLKSVSDTLHLGNDIIENCYRYYFDIFQMADEEEIITLAPGIGIVKESYPGGWADRIALKKVKINGVVREF